jgi:hypothetical protein
MEATLGLYDFMVDASQSGQIAELYEEMDKLRERVQNLEKWVVYLKEKDEMKNKIDTLPNGDFKVLPECIECGEPATHVRCTQFAGDHPFCQVHAELQEDFEQNDSYTFWKKL